MVWAGGITLKKAGGGPDLCEVISWMKDGRHEKSKLEVRRQYGDMHGTTTSSQWLAAK
jgi:hypothetical protein